MATLSDLKKYLDYEFSSSSVTGKDYLSFQTKYINYIRSVCRNNCWEISHITRGHYWFSCFIRNAENKYVYLSISDVRHYTSKWYTHILIRRADNDCDYHGHGNYYTHLEELQKSITKLFSYA